MVDAEYSNTRGFLGHYSNCRYHIQVFCHGNAPQNKEERFNFHRSWLRNIIECCFGVIKVWFSILKQKAPYPFITKLYIVIIVMAVHNFIRQEAIFDKYFAE